MRILEAALRAFGASHSYIEMIERELELLGITELEDFGPVQLHTGVHVIGKGQNSVVIRGKLLGDFICSCKILRPDASRSDLLHEARAILHANRVSVGPRLLTFTRHVLVYEYIDGIPVEKWLRGQVTREELLKVLREVLYQAYRLDSIGLLHDELSRPREHILVTSDLKVYIIDFETSSLGLRRGKKNVTQILNAFVLGGSELAAKTRQILELDADSIRVIGELARRYKQSPSIELLENIIKVISHAFSRG